MNIYISFSFCCDHLSWNMHRTQCVLCCSSRCADPSPLNSVLRETHLGHVLPQCCCKMSWRHDLQDQLEELQGEAGSACQRSSARPPELSPRTGSVTERTAVNTQHDFNKTHDLRNQCSERQLFSEGWKSMRSEAVHGLMCFSTSSVDLLKKPFYSGSLNLLKVFLSFLYSCIVSFFLVSFCSSERTDSASTAAQRNRKADGYQLWWIWTEWIHSISVTGIWLVAFSSRGTLTGHNHSSHKKCIDIDFTATRFPWGHTWANLHIKTKLWPQFFSY